MDELPFGYTHRQKRSHAQMEAHERSASPTWTYNGLPNEYNGLPFDPTLSFYHPPHSRDLNERRTPPSFDPATRPSSLYEPFNSLLNPPTERPSPISALHQHQHLTRPQLPRVEPMASSAPRRFAGDGFDYRRPVSSAREHEAGSVDLTQEEEDMAIDLSRDEDIIDLTADDSGYGASQDGNNAGQRGSEEEAQQSRSRRWNNAAPRLPRGMDIIIDLENGEEEWRMATPTPALEPGSPDFEIISSRQIDPPRREPPLFRRGPLDGDEVEFVRENALPESEARRRRDEEIENVMGLLGTMNGRFTHLRAQVDRFNAQVNRTADRFRRGGPVPPPRGPPRAQAHVRAFMAPALDFEMVGFDIGIPGPRAPEPPPTYEAPEKAPEGFTRSPEEKDVLCCPNCGDELCVGDDDVKRQVWIVKACGHVYCGECTANRSAKRSVKGKERPANTKPFKECVVEECGKHVAHRKTMIQIFL